MKVVLIFTKVPIVGLVKTRLAHSTCLTEHEVVLLAEAMFKDTLTIASESNASRIDIGFTPEKEISVLKKIVKDVQNDGYFIKPVKYIIQNGENFDDRFGSVIKSSLNQGANEIVILGSDLPYLDPKIINNAFEYLIQNPKNLILGPASGGGIYLVGLTKIFNWRSFANYLLFRGGVEIIQFVNYCKTKKVPLIILPALSDIDLEEDLISLIAYIQALSISKKYKGFHYPMYSADVIKELGIIIENKDGQTRNRKIAKRRE
ncbi:MAG: DUF2064 domain-containing protein [Candidatus Hermodarchaeota archaeon]